MDRIWKDYGAAVRAARRAMNWTQVQLAGAIERDERTIGRIEAGERTSADTAMAIEAVIGVSAPAPLGPETPLPVVPTPADASHARQMATLVEAAVAEADVVLVPDAAAFEAANPPPALVQGLAREAAVERLTLRINAMRGLCRVVPVALGIVTLGIVATIAWVTDAGMGDKGSAMTLAFVGTMAGMVAVAAEDVAVRTRPWREARSALETLDASRLLRSRAYGVTPTELVAFAVENGVVTTSRTSLKAIDEVRVEDEGRHATITVVVDESPALAIRYVKRDGSLARALELVEAARSRRPYAVAA